MPLASVRLKPGIDTEATELLNEAGISTSNRIRWKEGLPEKLGGWQKFYSNSVAGIPRAMHGWEDLNSINHFAIGATQSLNAVTNGSGSDITPNRRTTNPAVSFTTTSGSASVSIHDVGSNASIYDSIIINTPISVGGLILQGAYDVTSVGGADDYTILAQANATANVTNGGAVPVFTTTNLSPSVNVLLNGHGLSVGGTAAFVASTTGNGVTIQGLYTIVSVVDANNYKINASNTATASSSFSMNGGNAQIVYEIATGPQVTGTGWGVGGWGTGGWGSGITTSAAVGSPITATDWTLGNFGEILISCPTGGPIYQWSPSGGLFSAQIISEAPTRNTGIIITMPQRQIMAFGASVFGVLDPLLLAWCDIGDFYTWIGTTTNQAGTFRLSTGSKIVGARQGPSFTYIWTDIGLWYAQYIGPQLVYGFNEVSQGCGLMGLHGHGVLADVVYWISQKAFFQLSGGTVAEVPCSVWDVIFQDLDTANAYKVRAAANSQFGEIMWFYPSLSGGTGENDRYVKFTPKMGIWDYGSLVRTAWIDQSVLGPPIGGHTNGFSYQHEVATDDDGQPMGDFLVTGYWLISEGQDIIMVDWFIPDFQYGLEGHPQNATPQVTLNYKDFPGSASQTSGPFTCSSQAKYFNPRLRGRQVSMRIDGNSLGSWWRMGRPRFMSKPTGRVGLGG